MATVGIFYSTKDRVELTRQTFPSLQPDRTKFFVHWVDGSKTVEGQELWREFEKDVDQMHANVTGGADVAIVFSLSEGLKRGYDYIGLVENDVLLEEGWFERIMALFETPDLKVGSVSARCLADRILVPRDDYAVMSNLGAGMVVFTREAAEAVLDHFHTGTFTEYAFLRTFYTGEPCPLPHEISDPSQNWFMTADWFFEGALLSKGMVSLACTPSMAKNIDQQNDIVQCAPTLVDPNHDWDNFLKNINAPRYNFGLGHYEPSQRTWVAHPHQILKALPEAWQGSWKLRWCNHNGPFAMETAQGDESLSLPFYGVNMGILINTQGQKATMSARVRTGTSRVDLVEKEEFVWMPMQFQGVNTLDLEVSFDKPGIIIATLGFDTPQPWFKDGCGIRYDDLKRFLCL